MYLFVVLFRFVCLLLFVCGLFFGVLMYILVYLYTKFDLIFSGVFVFVLCFSLFVVCKIIAIHSGMISKFDLRNWSEGLRRPPKVKKFETLTQKWKFLNIG